MSAPLPTSKRIFDLEGEAQVNDDGRSRQEELRRCLPGEAVHLRLDPAQSASPAAVTILSERGVPIGRLTRQYAALLAPLLEAGRPHRARLHCLRGGLPAFPRYGARISIAWEGQADHPYRPLDDAQIRFRELRSSERLVPRGTALGTSVEAGRPALAVKDRETTRLTLFLAGILGFALLAYLLAERLGSVWCWACG